LESVRSRRYNRNGFVMDDSYYDVAQICLNGHIINQSSATLPVSNRKHCSICGAETITQCEACRKPIKGYHWVPGVIGFGSLDKAPAFCDQCGKPYAWTEARLDAARDLADQLDLDIPERVLLEKSIEDIVKDTPRAPAAAIRFKGVVAKSKPWALGAFKEILYSAVSETVRKSIWP